MDFEKHMHRTMTVQAVLALWAEHEDKTLSEVMRDFNLLGLTDEGIIAATKLKLKPKSQYFLVQVDPQNSDVMGGYDRKLFDATEYADFVLNFGDVEKGTQVYTTTNMLSEDEVASVRDDIERQFLSYQTELKAAMEDKPDGK
jgi:hypothetical protein